MNHLYHYTDRESAKIIRKEGVLRAYPLTLHRDMMGRDKGKDTDPAVWITANPDPEVTVVVKLTVAGWRMPWDLFRFVLPSDLPGVIPFPVSEHEPALGCEPIWWQWARATAAMAGSRPEDWRTVGRDIPAAEWVGMEVLYADQNSNHAWRRV